MQMVTKRRRKVKEEESDDELLIEELINMKINEFLQALFTFMSFCHAYSCLSNAFK